MMNQIILHKKNKMVQHMFLLSNIVVVWKNESLFRGSLISSPK